MGIEMVETHSRKACPEWHSRERGTSALLIYGYPLGADENRIGYGDRNR
jgi:hypothetical protein